MPIFLVEQRGPALASHLVGQRGEAGDIGLRARDLVAQLGDHLGGAGHAATEGVVAGSSPIVGTRMMTSAPQACASRISRARRARGTDAPRGFAVPRTSRPFSSRSGLMHMQHTFYCL